METKKHKSTVVYAIKTKPIFYRKVKEAIKMIKNPQTQWMAFNFLHGMTLEEIAEMESMKKDAVRTRMDYFAKKKGYRTADVMRKHFKREYLKHS